MKRYRLNWRLKDWWARKRGLQPFYSFYAANDLSPAEARARFEAGKPTAGWVAVLTPDDVPDSYPTRALIRRHVEPILPPWLD